MNTLTTLQARTANFPIAGYRVAVADVLGNLRDAEIFEGGGFPWFNCPFCWCGVYVNGLGPDVSGAVVSINCECVNPWCLANPNMPKAEAERHYKKAKQEADERAARERNTQLARERRESENEAKRERYAAIRAEAERRRACVGCALASAAGYSREPKYTKHRGPCPRILVGYKHR